MKKQRFQKLLKPEKSKICVNSFDKSDSEINLEMKLNAVKCTMLRGKSDATLSQHHKIPFSLAVRGINLAFNKIRIDIKYL